MLPIGIREDENIAFGISFGIAIHLAILTVKMLKIEQPVIQNVFVALRDLKMSLDHKIRIQSYNDLDVI